MRQSYGNAPAGTTHCPWGGHFAPFVLVAWQDETLAPLRWPAQYPADTYPRSRIDRRPPKVETDSKGYLMSAMACSVANGFWPAASA
jgi:hypothetical protein